MAEPEHTNAAHRVYTALREAVIDRTHRPGTVLSRPALAETFGTSPTPVREALLRLEREGFVQVRPQAGTVVAPISVLSLHQAGFLRRSLEEAVVRRLAGRAKTSKITPEVSEGMTPAEVSAADDTFHANLFDAAGMGQLHSQLTPVLVPLERLRALTHVTDTEIAAMVKDHADILDRIARADAEGAAQAMAAHLASDLQGLAALCRTHPDMFTD
ncbi:MAG: GntR family transcriptional regulator [Paracoccaceae bacterium]